MKKRRHAFTLMEIMLVILIISLIGGVIGYSMKGSLEEGKAFKTQQAISKVYELIQLRIAETGDIEEICNNIEKELEKTGLVKRVKELLKDGWGSKFEIKKIKDEITIKSKNLEKYIDKKGKKKSDYYPWLSDSDDE